MFRSLIVFSLLVCHSLAFWSPCPGFSAPRDVISPQCSDRCTIVRGGSLFGTVFFTPVAVHSSLLVFIGADGTNIPVSPPADQACNTLFRGGAGGACPTVPNAEHEWRLDIPIPLGLPALSNANFRVELVDFPSLQTVTCFTAIGDLL